MKKVNCFLCAVSVMLALCSCASNTQDNPSNSPQVSPPADDATETKSTKSKSVEQIEEYLTGLGYDVVKTKESKGMMEFMLNLSGFSDQDLSERPEDWDEITDSLLAASSGILDNIPDLDVKNIAVYLQDTAGNNYLSVANGKQTYSAFADTSSGGYNPPTITLAEYNEIKTGMTFEEVYNIIGGAGEVISEVDLGLGEEYRTVMQQWDGVGVLGANANVTFQGGRVTGKSQFGLE